jgi:hypothetical protein
VLTCNSEENNVEIWKFQFLPGHSQDSAYFQLQKEGKFQLWHCDPAHILHKNITVLLQLYVECSQIIGISLFSEPLCMFRFFINILYICHLKNIKKIWTFMYLSF